MNLTWISVQSWPRLTWGNAPTTANADFSFDVVSHIQATANGESQ